MNNRVKGVLIFADESDEGLIDFNDEI